jgi:NAD(P)-dependent dehydrogenase (short-subunit alcohol dehydrogenase family)
MISLFDISNEIIVLTGVNGMLGNEYAVYLLEQDATVIGIDISKNEKTTTLLNKYHSKFNFFECDITRSESLLKTVSEIKNKIGIPTVLINNAAIDSPPSSSTDENGPFENYSESSWDKVMSVNLKGVFLCCQFFGKEMVVNKKGSIINISSIYGMVSPDQSIYEYRRKNGEEFYKPIAYSVSKSGLLNLTRYLANYWGNKFIRVNTLTLAGVFNNQDPLFLKEYTSRIPIGRMASSDDYFGALHFLCGDSSKYMTGSNMVVDGGWTSK